MSPLPPLTSAPALQWLAFVCAWTGLMWMPYIVNRIQELGPPGWGWFPQPDPAPRAPWAGRAVRAHVNALENLAVFAPLMLAAQWLAPGNATALMAAQLYAGARVAHALICWIGAPIVWRTLSFLSGVVAQMMLVSVIFRHPGLGA